MERRNKKVKFRKLGGGSFRLPGRIIKPNQVFEAYPEDIPEGFRDVVKPLDPSDVHEAASGEEQDVIQIEAENPVFYKKHKGGGVYDIIRESDDKVISTVKGKIEADHMLDQLNPDDIPEENEMDDEKLER